MRPTPVRDVVTAVVNRFSEQGVGIEDKDHSAIHFKAALQDEPIEKLIRAAKDLPGVYVRCEDVDAGERQNVGEMILRMTIGCHYFHRGGGQSSIERSAWDVILRMAQAAGEEVARPSGSNGTGNLFGLASGHSRVSDVVAEGPMSVRPLDDEHGTVVHGEYRFFVEYRMNTMGSTD